MCSLKFSKKLITFSFTFQYGVNCELNFQTKLLENNFLKSKMLRNLELTSVNVDILYQAHN